MTYSAELYNSLKDQTAFAGFVYCVCGFFLFLLPLYIYMLYKVLPPQVTTYKCLLCSCCFSSFTLAALRALWIPVPTLPLTGVYSAGIIGSLGPTANLICLNIYFLCLVNTQLCFCYCLIFQFSALRPFSMVSHLGNCPHRVTICCATYFIVMGLLISFLLHFSVVDRSEYLEHALNTNNMYAVELITKQPSWIGFSAAIKPSVIAFGFFVTFPDFAVACFSIFLTARIYFIIEGNKDSVSAVTHNLEKNLYRTFAFRSVNIIGMFTIPYLGTAAAFLFEVQIPQLGVILHIVMICQSIVCLCGTIIIVKHFRVFIFRCFYQKVSDSSTSSSTSGSRTRTTLTVTSESVARLPTKF